MGEAVEPLAPPTVLYKCWLVEDGVRTTQLVGGGYDGPAAVTIACTAYRTLMDYNPRTNIGIEVLNDTGVAVAYIGRWFEEQWGPATLSAGEG